MRGHNGMQILAVDKQLLYMCKGAIQLQRRNRGAKIISHL